MKKSKLTDSQIMDALKRAEAGVAVPEICRELSVSTATFYNWRSKYGGMDVSLMARTRELEAENARLHKMYVDEEIKAEIVAEALSKKLRLSTRREMAREAVASRGVSIRVARQAFGVSQTCYRYERQRNAENEHCRLAATADRQSSQFGLGAVFPVPAQREGLRPER